MAIEIERKFLVTSDLYKQNSTCKRITQGYICSERERIVRVRIYGEQAFITIKDASIGFARHEFEYEIPVADAEQLLEFVCKKPIINKTRYKYEYAGRCWEIDEFHGENEGLVFAELELESEQAVFEKPEFIGKEVTADEHYYNANLLKNPYKNWK